MGVVGINSSEEVDLHNFKIVLKYFKNTFMNCN